MTKKVGDISTKIKKLEKFIENNNLEKSYEYV